MSDILIYRAEPGMTIDQAANKAILRGCYEVLHNGVIYEIIVTCHPRENVTTMPAKDSSQ